jgi:hypothetical protein
MLRARPALPLGVLTIAMTVVSGLAAPAQAFPPNGGSETSTGTAPANGSLITATDNIPPSATQGSFAIQPLPGTDAAAFDEVTSVIVEDFPWLAKQSKRSQAVLACVLMSYLPIVYKPADYVYTFRDLELQAAMLNVCLRMALAIPKPPAASDHAHAAAAGACGRIDAAVRVKLTHSAAGYGVAVSGAIRKVTRPRLKVTCRRRGKGVLLTVRPRKRGQSLRSAAGPKLAIAYTNPTSKPVGVRTTFTAH